MSEVVDKRVVEMRFDNEQFERNVKVSIATLDELRSALNMDGVEKSLANIEEATNKIDLSGISSGIEAIQDKFSTLGIAGRRVIENLTDSVVNFAKDKILAIPNFIKTGIVEGGIRRAFNIENAKFQLEGLGVAWEDISEDISYAVDGTAYGLDSAAKAASQLAASGVEFGEAFGATGSSPMAKALRGISGLAAMTNREYDDIARVFTKAAGSGRVMGDELEMISERGMNAAADLAKFFNSVVDGSIDTSQVSETTLRQMADAMEEYGITTKVTEKDIREMASKSLISFGIFAEAMDNAYGEHAKEANKTFNGAMSNIKSALGRIGADYVSPLIKSESAVVNLLNSIRERVNDFRSMITSQLAPGVTNAILGMAQKLSDFISSSEFTKYLYALRNLINGILNIFKGIGSVLKPIGQAFLEVFAPVSSLGTSLMTATKSFRDFTEKLKLSDEASEKLKNTFKGVFSILSIGLNVVRSVLEIVGKVLSIILPPLISGIGWLLDKILIGTGFIGEWLSKANEWMKRNNVLIRVFELLKNVIIAVGNGIKNVAIRAFNALSGVISPITEKLKALKDIIAGFVRGAIGKVKDFFTGLFSSFKMSPNFEKALDNVRTVLSFIGSFAKSSIGAIKDFFITLFASTDSLSGAFDKVKFALGGLFSHIGGLFKSIGSLIKETVSSIIEGFKRLVNPPKPEKLEAFTDKTKTLLGSAKTSVSGTIDKFKEFSHEKLNPPSTEGLSTFAQGTSTIFNKIKDGVTAAYNGLREAFSKLLSFNFSDVFKKDAIGGGSGGVAQMPNPFQAIIDWAKGIDWTPLERVKDGFVSIMKDLYDAIKPALQNMTFSDILDAVHTVIDVFIGKKFMDFLGSLKDVNGSIKGFIDSFAGIGKGISGIEKSISNVLDSVKKTINAFATDIKVDALKKVAIAIAILSGALIALSFVEPDKLAMPLAAVSILLGEMIGLMIVLNRFQRVSTTTFSKDKGFSSSRNQSMVGTIISIGITLILLSKALDTLSQIDPNRMDQALIAFTAVMLELGVFLAVLSKLDIDKLGVSTGIGFFLFGNAVKSLAGTIALLASINPEAALRGIEAFSIIIVSLIAVFTSMSDVDNSLKSASAILVLSTAMVIFSGAIALMGAIPWENLIRGLVGIGGVLAAVVIALNHLDTGDDVLKQAAAMVVLGAAMVIFSGAVALMGAIPWQNLIKGLIGLAGTLTMTVLALKFIGSQDVIRKAAALVVIGASLLIFAGAVAAMGAIPWQNMLTGLVGIGAVLLMLTLTVTALKGSEITLLAFGGALALIGLAIGLVGAGLLAFSLALELIAISGTAAAIVLVEMGKILLEGILTAVIELAPKFKDALVALIQAGVDALKESIGVLVEGILLAITETLDMLIQYGPDIAAKLVDFIIKVLDAIQPRFPELCDKILDMLGTLFGKIMERLETVHFDAIDKALEAVLGVEAIILALGFVNKINFGTIISGLLKVGIALTILTGIIALMGGLNQIEGLSWLVEEGGDLLEKVGTAIGQFIGGIVGGIAEGVFASLPQIADDLSTFMDKMQVFIDKASGLEGKSFDGLKSLAEALLVLTADELIHGLTSFLFGNNTLADFGEQLADFAPHLNDFVEATSGITDENAESAKRVFGILSDAAAASQSIPNMGGMLGAIVGENNLSDFGKEMAKFSPFLRVFCNTVRGVTDKDVETSGYVFSILSTAAEASNKIPNMGGMLGAIVGENNLGTFGVEMGRFAPYFIRFCNTVRGNVTSSDVDTVGYVVDILGRVATASQSIPNMGGMLADFIGDNKLSDFAAEMAKAAPDLCTFASTVSGTFDNATVSSAVNVIGMLVDIQKKLDETGGVFSFLMGTDLPTFGYNLKQFGDAFQGYSEAISGVDTAKVTAVTAEIDKLFGITQDLTSIDSGKLYAFGNSLKTFGQNGLQGFEDAFTDANAEESVNNAMTAVLNQATTAMTQNSETIKNNARTIGENTVIYLANGMSDKQQGVYDTTADLCKGVIEKAKGMLTQKIFGTFGSLNVCGGLIAGILEKRTAVLVAIETICSDILTKVRTTLDKGKFRAIAVFAVQGIADGLSDETARAHVSSSAQSLSSSVLGAFTNNDFYTKLYNIGRSAVQGLVDGLGSKLLELRIRSEQIADEVDKAIRKKAEIRSPSRVMFRDGAYMILGFINGLKRYAATLTRTSGGIVENGVINPIDSAVSMISGMIEDGINAEPTIRPVLDLTDIQNGMAGIDGMFASGFEVSGLYRRALNAGISTSNIAALNGRLNQEHPTSTYNFTQNNYSPKALSRSEIYRQTRNQISLMKGAVGRA